MKSGTLFDNVLICDDPEYAKQLVEETWAKYKDVCDAAFCFCHHIAHFPSDFHIWVDF